MSDLLKALYDEDWAFEMADSAEFAALSGFHDATHPEPLQDVSPAGYRRRAEHSADMRRRVASILAEHGGALSAQDKVRPLPVAAPRRVQHDDGQCVPGVRQTLRRPAR